MERGLWADVKGAIGAMIGLGLGALLFGSFDVLVYGGIGATVFVILSAVARRWRHRSARQPAPPGG